MTIRILLADDHRMFREALRVPLGSEPDLEIVGEASTGEETLSAVAQLAPDVLVLDIALPDMNGIEVARRIAHLHPTVRVVALSGFSDRLFVEEMLKAGAHGYVVKSAGSDDLVEAIRAVSSGRHYLSPEVSSALARCLHTETPSGPPPHNVLGRREQEVLIMLAQGRRSGEIAEALGITSGTVDVHRRNIKQKLGIHTTAELTRYAIREGLTSI